MFGYRMHGLGSDLHFKGLAVRPHNLRMERLVAVRLRLGDVVIEQPGNGHPEVVDDAQCHVTVRDFSDDHTDGKKIVLWHLCFHRGQDLELLSQSYDSREAAIADGQRMYSWIQMAEVIAVPSTCDFQRIESVVKPGKVAAPTPLERAADDQQVRSFPAE